MNKEKLRERILAAMPAGRPTSIRAIRAKVDLEVAEMQPILEEMEKDGQLGLDRRGPRVIRWFALKEPEAAPGKQHGKTVKYLTTDEAGKVIGVSAQVILFWLKRGLIPGALQRVPGAPWMIPEKMAQRLAANLEDVLDKRDRVEMSAVKRAAHGEKVRVKYVQKKRDAPARAARRKDPLQEAAARELARAGDPVTVIMIRGDARTVSRRLLELAAEIEAKA